jgi:hypothetical protein
MQTEKIIKTITKIFNGADERDWEQIQDAMADDVLLDYSSMNGSPAAITPSAKIIEAWKGFLPGFDNTHHQISGFKVDQQNDIALVHFFGKADHFIGKDTWAVAGTYDMELAKSDNDWKVVKFKFNLLQQSGNTELPQKAAEITSRKNI